MQVEEHGAVENRLDQLQWIRAPQSSDDVACPTSMQRPTAGEEIRFAIVLRISGENERVSGPG